MKQIIKFFNIVLQFGFVNAAKVILAKTGRLGSGFVKISLPQNCEIYLRSNTSDASVFYQIFVEDQYTSHLFPIDAKIIMDCGAYTGLSTLYFSMCYPQATIFAVEPDPENYAMLVMNTKGKDNVVCINKALRGDFDSVAIVDCNSEKWAVQVDKCPQGSGLIETTTIDVLMAEFSIETIDILKLDIEGSEKSVMPNAKSWLAHVKLVCVELHDFMVKGCSMAFYSAIMGYDFEQDVKGENVIVKLLHQSVESSPRLGL